MSIPGVIGIVVEFLIDGGVGDIADIVRDGEGRIRGGVVAGIVGLGVDECGIPVDVCG